MHFLPCLLWALILPEHKSFQPRLMNTTRALHLLPKWEREKLEPRGQVAEQETERLHIGYYQTRDEQPPSKSGYTRKKC